MTKRFRCDECKQYFEPMHGEPPNSFKTEIWIKPRDISTERYEVKVAINTKPPPSPNSSLDLCWGCVQRIGQRALSEEGLKETKDVDAWRTRLYMGTLV